MLTIDDRHRLKDFGMYVSSGFADPNAPEFNEVLLNVPGRPGRVLVKEEIGIRKIQLPIQFIHYGSIYTQEKLNRFSDLFYDDEGKRKEVKLSLDHWQNKYVLGFLASPIDSNRSDIIGGMNLEFVCYDPYKYSPVLGEEIAWGSEEITFESHYILGHEGAVGLVSVTSNTSVDVYVDGLVVYPTIEIQGTASNLTIKNDGQSINFPDFVNSNWEVERFNSWQNGQERFVNAHKFKLHKGRNTIEVTGDNLDIQIRIRYRDKYK